MHVRLGPFYVAHAIHSVETRSLPTLAHCFPRNFTFYVAHPIRSIHTTVSGPSKIVRLITSVRGGARGAKHLKQKAAVSDSGYRARVLALTSSSTAIHHSCIYIHHSCTARSEAELPFQAFLRFGRSTAPAAAHAQQMAHSPDNENQYCNCDNCQREKVANGIGKNVIRMSRVEAIEAFKRGWQCC
jgi:hypothetical protein